MIEIDVNSMSETSSIILNVTWLIFFCIQNEWNEMMMGVNGKSGEKGTRGTVANQTVLSFQSIQNSFLCCIFLECSRGWAPEPPARRFLFQKPTIPFSLVRVPKCFQKTFFFLKISSKNREGAPWILPMRAPVGTGRHCLHYIVTVVTWSIANTQQFIQLRRYQSAWIVCFR